MEKEEEVEDGKEEKEEEEREKGKEKEEKEEENRKREEEKKGLKYHCHQLLNNYDKMKPSARHSGQYKKANGFRVIRN